MEYWGGRAVEAHMQRETDIRPHNVLKDTTSQKKYAAVEESVRQVADFHKWEETITSGPKVRDPSWTPHAYEQLGV